MAQNGSMEDSDSLQSSTELDKQDNQTVASRNASNATQHQTIRSSPNVVPWGQGHHQQQPVGRAKLCQDGEEERRKANYEAEMKSWLLERMQAPIKGRSRSSGCHCFTAPFHCCVITEPLHHHYVTVSLQNSITAITAPSLHCIATPSHPQSITLLLYHCIITAILYHRIITHSLPQSCTQSLLPTKLMHHCIAPLSLHNCISLRLHYATTALLHHHCTTPLTC